MLQPPTFPFGTQIHGKVSWRTSFYSHGQIGRAASHSCRRPAPRHDSSFRLNNFPLRINLKNIYNSFSRSKITADKHQSQLHKRSFYQLHRLPGRFEILGEQKTSLSTSRSASDRARHRAFWRRNYCFGRWTTASCKNASAPAPAGSYAISARTL